MASSACWYSAGQTLWAGFGILATLWYAQCWRRSPRPGACPRRASRPMLAGWFWTIGHIAGPGRGALPLARRPPPCRARGRRARWRRRSWPCRSACLWVAGKIDSTVSFHGRTTGEAARPVEGFLHTAQAIPENLVLGNLGLRPRRPRLRAWCSRSSLLGVWFIRALAARRAARVQPAGMHRARGGAGQLPGRVDRPRLLAVSLPADDQPGDDRPLV